MKNQVFETVLAIIVLVLIAYYSSRVIDKEVILTDKKCCAIIIDRANNLMSYSDHSKPGDTIRRVIGNGNEKELINLYNGYCNKNHH